MESKVTGDQGSSYYDDPQQALPVDEPTEATEAAGKAAEPASEPEPESEAGPPSGTLTLSSTFGEFAPFRGAGESPVNEDQAKQLARPFLDEEHDIKPTGEVFVPQVHYRRRLNEVFRPGGWAMIEMSDVKTKQGEYQTLLIQKFHLVAGGRFLAGAWGEMTYNPRNENTTEATALEGVKSNALMRCCKDLGIASECWDKRWCDAWKKKHAVEVWTTNVSKDPKKRGKRKNWWRRKEAAPFTFPWSEKSPKEDKSDNSVHP